MEDERIEFTFLVGARRPIEDYEEEEPLRIRSGMEEDLIRDFGPDRLLIGFPVEQDDDEAEEQSEQEESE